MKIGILASAVGLAVSAVAIAEATTVSDLIPLNKTSFVHPSIQIYQQTGFPRLSDGIVGERRLSPAAGGREFRVPAKHSDEGVTGLRGMNPVSVGMNFENVAHDVSLGNSSVRVAATSQSGTLPANIGWELDGQPSVAFVRVISPTANPSTPAPPAGPNGVANNTKMVRHRVGAAQPANGFFEGHSTSLVRNHTVTPVDYFPVAPTADSAASASCDVYNTSVGTLDTFEPIAAFTGFITGRVMWGGTCSEDAPGDCTDIGLPIGALTTYVSLGPDPTSFTTGLFVPSSICEDAVGTPIPGCVPPAGAVVGSPAAIVIGQWHRMIGETSSDGRFTAYIDRLDGNPRYSIYSNTIITSGFIDELGSNCSFELANAETFFDNVVIAGEPFVLPTPPELDCPYFDNIEWLNTGPVLGQSQRYFAALSSALTVLNDGARGKVLSQVNNVSSDNEYREEFRSALPSSFATEGDPWSLCVDVRTTGATVRGFAPDSELTNFVVGGVTARVYLGREDPNDPMSPFYENSIYVQTNVAYDPVDDPFTTNPSDNVPVIGVDIADTGANWANDGQYRELCFTVAHDNAMSVSVAGVTIYNGEAFSNGATVMRFESENQTFGSGSQLRVNDLDFACSALPVVSLPALTIPYLDNIEWGVVGLPPNRHIDDPMEDPLFSTRYGSANGVVIAEENLARGTSTVVAMQNVFRDTTHIAPPDINAEEGFIFQQFTSDLPGVTVNATTRWVLTMDWAMNDFLTSRGFSPAQAADVGSAFELVGYLWYSAQDDTFYIFAAAEGALPEDPLININTGVTRASLGIVANQTFSVGAEYNLDTDMIDWSVNNTVVGSSHPIVGTDDLGDPRIHRNLNALFVWGGDDDTAPAAEPFSTLFLDNIRVTTGAAPCPGDSNGDQMVNFSDLNAVLATFGQNGAGLPGDVNGDNMVNFADLNLVLANFGTTCP